MLTKSDPKSLGNNPTKQEILDFIATNLIKQGSPSVDADLFCKYRYCDGSEGEQLKCAIGWLLPDDMYESKMDRDGGGYGIDGLVEYFNVPKYFKKYVRFLSNLQAAHDSAAKGDDFVTDLKNALQGVAKKHKLQFDPTKFETAR